MGKDYLNDILESKRTLMVIHCLARGRRGTIGSGSPLLLRLGAAKSTDAGAGDRRLHEQYGSIEYARGPGPGPDPRGAVLPGQLPRSTAREVLASMADFFLERDS